MTVTKNLILISSRPIARFYLFDTDILSLFIPYNSGSTDSTSHNVKTSVEQHKLSSRSALWSV